MQTQFPKAIWETFYVTLLSTALAVVIGLPLGVLLVAGEKGGVLPLPKALMSILNVTISIHSWRQLFLVGHKDRYPKSKILTES